MILCRVHFLATGAILGDPNGKEGLQRVILTNLTQAQVTEIDRNHDTAEKLAGGLLLLLFSLDELASGNCTKPIRDDIKQLDGNRLWAIKCKCLVLSVPNLHSHFSRILIGHIDFKFPISEELDGKGGKEKSAKRWKDIMQKNLNAKCRHFRNTNN